MGLVVDSAVVQFWCWMVLPGGAVSMESVIAHVNGVGVWCWSVDYLTQKPWSASLRGTRLVVSI